MREIAKLADRVGRMPEAGRIRLGIQVPTQSGKTRPASISTFRFTSPHAKLITQLAHLYGGEPKPWTGGKDKAQFEVITTASTIPIFLPKDAIDTWYELWAGGGLQRRCDGEVTMVPTKTADGWEPLPSPCICDREQKMACQAITRMNVIIPSIEFAGVWRLETKGWNAKEELPGMAAVIEAMTEGGRLVQAELGVQKRTVVRFGETKNFIVPVLSLPYTAQEMLEGGANVQALTAPAPLALVPGPDPFGADFSRDEDVIDVTEVEEDPQLDALSVRMWETCAQLKLDHSRLWPAVKRQVGVTSTVTNEQTERIVNCIARLDAGELSVLGYNADGSVIWKVS